MATQEASPAPTPTAQVVGNAFVGQYYGILHHSPESVHKFYHDSSSLSRPDSTGTMTTVTTLQAINEKILSLNFGDYTAEIITADAQNSYEKGFIVLVTGCLTGKDNLRKKFTQTFFLAPQDKGGFFVLNDVFRYVEEFDSVKSTSPALSIEVPENVPEAPLTPKIESTHSPNILVVDPATTFEEDDPNNGTEVSDHLVSVEKPLIEEDVVEVEPLQADEHETVAPIESAPVTQEDAPKKSYASIVKVAKPASGPVYAVARSVRSVPVNSVQPTLGAAKPAPTPAPEPASNGENVPESGNLHEEAEGHSIYVRNLPFDATVEQLEAEFTKFGPIKHDGIQVRSNKQGFCFGFVEFEQSSSVQSAIEASPVMISDHKAFVEEKRTTTRVGSTSGGGGRYSSGRGGGFRSDSFRSRVGAYGGGRGGYGRSEFRNSGEFSGRPRVSTGRNGESYQRTNQNGGGRGGAGGHQAGANCSSGVPAA